MHSINSTNTKNDSKTMVEASNGSIMKQGSCCPKGSWGALTQKDQDDGPAPKGNVVTLDNNLEVYVSKGGESDKSFTSTTTTKVLLLIGDIFGWSTRTKGICDRFSDKGYEYVLMPDFFRGETVTNNPEGGFVPWIKKFTYDNNVKVDVKTCLKYIESQSESSSVSVDLLGFCWGAWGCMKLCADDSIDAKIQKVAVAHPAFGIEQMAFNGNEVDVFQKVQKSTKWCMLASGDEPDNCKENGEIYNLVKNNCGISKVYSDMKHGWIARGDCTSDQQVKEQCLEGLEVIETFLLS